MRWILFGALAALVFFGCEEDESADIARIVLVEAPTRLAYMEDYWNPQPFETTAVRFIAVLIPPVAGLDTVVCNVFDDLGGKVDSFLLFDDGSLLEHWENTPCESALTGDSISNDGLFTRVIKSEEFTANYTGAQYTFEFRADHSVFQISGTSHTAHTWMPWFEVDNAFVSPYMLPPCADSMIVSLKLRCDSTDFIEAVNLGFTSYQGRLLGYHVACVAASGDSIWRGTISHASLVWEDMNAGGLRAGVETMLGLSATYSLTSYYEVPVPTIDLELLPDTFRMREWATPETLWVRARISLCEDRTPDRVSAVTWPFSGRSYWSVINHWSGDMNDCGDFGDETAHDGIFTSFTTLIADSFAQSYDATIRIEAGVTGNPNPCEWDERVNSVFAVKTVTLLPPQ